MFGWFKKIERLDMEELPETLQQFIKPMALLNELTEAVSEYSRAVGSGDISSPAYKRENDSVLGIWNDTRLEALSHLWGYGASDVTMLTDYQNRQQKKLLNALLQDKPHLEYPHQPSGDPIHDTLQALFRVYLFLGEAGAFVLDKETDRRFLELKHKNIFSDFEEHAKSLQASWSGYEQALHGSKDLPSMPPTILETLYRDVTKKSKTIALSAQFGPDYHAGMKRFLNLAREQIAKQKVSEETISMQLHDIECTMQALMAADDPDDVT